MLNLALALNARDAMPSGGELRIEAGIETVDAAAAADLEIAPGAYVQIAVHDNGEGMDGSTLARVFEPFFTTKKSSRGSGLGMAMVHGFVRKSGGAVRIRSRQACGTTVALLLPRADGYTTQGDEPGRELTDPASWLAGKLVLLVEDAHDVRKVVRKQLAALGCAVLEAESGQEAAGMVENIDSIALVVSDVARLVVGTLERYGYPAELIARVRGILRRCVVAARPSSSEPVKAAEFAGWRFELARHVLIAPDGRCETLSVAEAQLLRRMLERPNQILSREQLLEGRGVAALDRSIDLRVSRLRKRFEENPQHAKLIKTVYGAGYLFCADVRWG